MNQVEEFLGQSQAERPAEERPVEHPVEHPEEHSGEHPEEYPVEHPDRDRLMNLQECRDEYDECVSAPVGLGQQNSTVFGVDPPNAILESTHRHCAKNRRRCIDRVREREEKTDDRRQRTEDVNIRTSRTEERQPFLQPPLRIAPVDGVHATSFALGALVAFTLSAVAYFIRRPRGTKTTDSRGAYGAATV